MGFLFSFIFVGVLLAFNMFAVDTMMRMRTDIQIIRKALAGIKETTNINKTPTPPTTSDNTTTVGKNPTLNNSNTKSKTKQTAAQNAPAVSKMIAK